MLDAMNNGKPFTCEYITFDENRRTGGDVKRIQAVVLNDKLNSRPLTSNEKKRAPKKKKHTRNVQVLVDGHPVDQIRTLHIPLIIKFNGESVMP